MKRLRIKNLPLGVNRSTKVFQHGRLKVTVEELAPKVGGQDRITIVVEQRKRDLNGDLSSKDALWRYVATMGSPFKAWVRFERKRK